PALDVLGGDYRDDGGRVVQAFGSLGCGGHLYVHQLEQVDVFAALGFLSTPGHRHRRQADDNKQCLSGRPHGWLSSELGGDEAPLTRRSPSTTTSTFASACLLMPKLSARSLAT